MNPTLRKIILAFLAIGATALAVIILKPKEEKKSEEKELALKAIKPLAVQNGVNEGQVEVRGKLEALQKIDIFSEANGVMNAQRFLEGNSFSKGELLLSINAQELAYSLQAQKSSLLNKVSGIMGDLTLDFPDEKNVWQSFLNNLDIAQPLPPLPTIKSPNLKRFIAPQDIFNSYYSIKANEEKLSKHSIYAPFSGFLTETKIKTGGLVRAGQPLGVFMNASSYEMQAEVSLSELKQIQKGTKITFGTAHIDQTWTGTVERINATVSAETQMAQVYIAIKGNGLKEGMYLFGSLKGASFENSFSLDRKLIKEGGVYTLEEGVIGFKKVNVLFESESMAIVSGLSDSDVLVANNVNGIYVGQVVKVVE